MLLNVYRTNVAMATVEAVKLHGAPLSDYKRNIESGNVIIAVNFPI